MKIVDILNTKRATLSFEVFPPKSDYSYEKVICAVQEVANLTPDFMSVTYGAGGSTKGFSLDVAKTINDRGVPALAHMTCITETEQSIGEKLCELEQNGIKNVLALRGDIPDGFVGEPHFKHASDLITAIKSKGDFCVGGACYPECHPESENAQKDVDFLKLKVDCGCDFLTSQMFFDNDVFYAFLERVQKAGVNVPVLAGIMPVTNAVQITRMLSLSGGTLPKKFNKIIERYGDDVVAMTHAGIAYATDQIIDLYANGVKGVHVYSMNKPYVAQKITENLKGII